MQFRLIPFCVCAAGFFLLVGLNYPGFLSFDAYEQLLDAKDGIYSDWHPPLMALLWHFTMKVIPGPFGMLVLESALLWTGTYLIAVTWFKGSGYRAFWPLIPSLLVFLPPIFSITGAISKDILMWASLVLAIGIAGTLSPLSKATSWGAGAKLAAAVVTLLLAISARYNAAFAAAPIAALCGIRMIGARPFGKAISAGMALLLIPTLMLLTLQIDRGLTTYHRNPWVSVALFDIAGVISRIPDRREQDSYYMSIPEPVRAAVSVDRLLATYSPEAWLNIFMGDQPAFVCPTGPQVSEIHHKSKVERCFQLSKGDERSFRRLWERAIIEHPTAWLVHRAAVFRHVIGLTPDPLWQPVFITPDPINFDPPPALVKIQLWMQHRFDRLSETWLYRPWVYLVLAIGISAFCLWSRTEESWQIGLIAASGLANEIALFFLAPSPDYRYSHYMIYSTFLSSALWLRAELAIRRPIALPKMA
jgi:hypothetical protein